MALASVSPTTAKDPGAWAKTAGTASPRASDEARSRASMTSLQTSKGGDRGWEGGKRSLGGEGEGGSSGKWTTDEMIRGGWEKGTRVASPCPFTFVPNENS